MGGCALSANTLYAVFWASRHVARMLAALPVKDETCAEMCQHALRVPHHQSACGKHLRQTKCPRRAAAERVWHVDPPSFLSRSTLRASWGHDATTQFPTQFGLAPLSNLEA